MRFTRRLVATLAVPFVLAACHQVPLPDTVAPDAVLEFEYEGAVAPESWIDAESAVAVPQPVHGDTTASYSIDVFAVDRAAATRVFDVPTVGPVALTFERSRFEAAMRALRDREVAAPVFLGVQLAAGREGELRRVGQTAYISRYELRGAVAAMTADPMIDVARDGVVLRVDPQRDTVAATLTSVTANRPFPFVHTAWIEPTATAMRYQVPMFVNERVTTSAPLDDDGVLVLGGLQADDPGRMLVACLRRVRAQPAD